MQTRTLPLSIVVITALLAPAWAATAGLAVAPARSPSVAAAHSIVNAYAATYGITGGAVAVIRGDDVLYERVFGLADLETGAPVTQATRFQLSSTTKIFTGTLMARLVQQGLVAYETPVREYLPALPESWSDVLLEDIMSHVSGLPEVLECNGPDDTAAALNCVIGMDRAAGRRAEFRYTQTNYMLAMAVIENVTGKSFADVLAQELLVPAGMTSAVINGNSSDEVDERATGYYPDGEGGLTLREYAFPAYLQTAAGLNVSLRDMTAFARALLGDELLEPRWKTRMWRAPLMADGQPGGYALGWELDPMRDGQRSAGHEGGFLTTFRIYPAADIAVVYLTNGMRSGYGLDEVADALAQAFVSDLFDPADALAYRAKVAYLTDGLDGTKSLLDGSAGDEALANSDIGDIAAWLADEVAVIGDTEQAENLRARYPNEETRLEANADVD